MNDLDGSIFLSHASLDKGFVDEVYRRLDASSAFYDIETISPGDAFLDAMKSGTSGKNIFVLFHSPSTKDTWVEYEMHLAEINHASNRGKVIVVPLGGETYKTLPDWMKKFMTCTEDFTPSDVVRQILRLQSELLVEAQGYNEIFVGREDLVRQIHLKTLGNLQTTGVPLQFILLSGLSGMGRATVANHVLQKSFKSMRQGGPTFDLPDMAEAIDLYLAMRQDIYGTFSKTELEEQIQAFQELEPTSQAELLIQLTLHWSKLNQVIIVKTKLGLRDRNRSLKPWLASFIEKAASHPAIRVIFVSERKLPSELSLETRNLEQFEVDELSDLDIQYILSELIDSRHYDAGRSTKLARNIHGHPATAHYASTLVNSGRLMDTLNENPDPIFAFQDRVIGSIMSADLLEEEERKILALLGYFPRLSFGLLARVMELPRKELAQTMWDLQEASLVKAAGVDYYTAPQVVANRARKELSETANGLLEEVRQLIASDIEGGSLDSQLIEALLIASASAKGEIPDSLSGLLTSSSLLTVVSERFYRAREMNNGSRDVYVSAYKLSKLALNMKASDDAVEQILFTGGDSAIRAGIYPEEIIQKLTDAALPSVYYLKGSYAFHVQKNDDEAAKFLKQSLSMKHFKLRNSRLLARSLIRSQDFSGALSVIDELPDWRVERDTGLLIQKVRALRGMRLHKDAEALERRIMGRDDEFGDIPLYNAGKALRDQRFDDAMAYVGQAEGCPKVNKFSVDLLKCATLIEQGDPSLLPLMVETANSVGRQYDAHQLQARHAVVQGDWQKAEEHLREIERKDYFDLQIALRMLKMKMEDPVVKSDALSMKKCREDIDEVARLSANSPEGYRSA